MSAATAPPEPVGDWAQWSAAMHARLHPKRHGDPTPDELHRYAVAWGESQVKYLTDWRHWERLQDETLEIIRKMSIELDAARAERDALRSRLALTEDEQLTALEMETWLRLPDQPYYHHAEVRRLLAIVDRLTRDGGGR